MADLTDAAPRALARGNPHMASDMLDILFPALALGCFGVAILYARAAAGF